MTYSSEDRDGHTCNNGLHYGCYPSPPLSNPFSLLPSLPSSLPPSFPPCLLPSLPPSFILLPSLPPSLPAARSLMISEASECEKLHAVLKDLTSVLQAVGRLSEHFTGDFFVPRLSEAQLLVQKLCFVAKYSTDTMLCKVSNGLPDVLDQDFVKM